MNSHNFKTNWYVITGGPSAGKTTMVNLLKSRGYKTTIEHARHYIETKQISGNTAKEIRKNQGVFQQSVLDMQIAQERELSGGEIVFLDRAIPDTLAYYHFLGLPEDEKICKAVREASYKKVFILDLLPLAKDSARTENEAAQKNIHRLITETYESLPFPIMRVPVFPPEERADFILGNL